MSKKKQISINPSAAADKITAALKDQMSYTELLYGVAFIFLLENANRKYDPKKLDLINEAIIIDMTVEEERRKKNGETAKSTTN